jgi:hypothetical protein
VDNPALVSENVAPYSSRFIHHSQSKISTTANTTNKPTDETSIEQIDIGSLQAIRKIMENSGLSQEASAIIFLSWRTSTQRQYRSYLTKWCTFCCQRQINIFTPTEVVLIEFLTMLYKSGVGYSSINTARSALSSYLTLGKSVSVGQLPLVKRFLKGVYNKNLFSQDISKHGMLILFWII